MTEETVIGNRTPANRCVMCIITGPTFVTRLHPAKWIGRCLIINMTVIRFAGTVPAN